MKKSNVLAMAVVAMFAGVAANVHAASTYAFPSTITVQTPTNDAGGASHALTGVAGFAAANGGTFANNSSTNYGVSGFKSSTSSNLPAGAGATWAATTLSPNSNGLGMKSDQSGDNQPNHALDSGPSTSTASVTTGNPSGRNGVGNTEAVMLSFSDSVVLSQVNFDWAQHDADFSVFRYVGTTPPSSLPPTLAGVGLAAGTNSNNMLGAMTAAGWELVGNYNYTNYATSTSTSVDTNTGNNYASTAGRVDKGYANSSVLNPGTANVNADGVGSSWWLVSAYNSNYGTASKNGGTLDQGDDYFKMYSVKVSNCVSDPTKPTKCGPPSNDVPEPGSLALVSLGVLGMLVQRRRRNARAAI